MVKAEYDTARCALGMGVDPRDTKFGTGLTGDGARRRGVLGASEEDREVPLSPDGAFDGPVDFEDLPDTLRGRG